MIRIAGPPDLPAVRDIVTEAYSVYISRIGREPAPMLDDHAAFIEAGRVHVLDAGEILGLIVLIEEPASLLIHNLAIRPSQQSKGYGRRLIEFAEEKARRQAAGRLHLYTNVLMVENQAIYHHLGFRETHRVREHGFKRVYMSKDISGPGPG